MKCAGHVDAGRRGAVEAVGQRAPSPVGGQLRVQTVGQRSPALSGCHRQGGPGVGLPGAARWRGAFSQVPLGEFPRVVRPGLPGGEDLAEGGVGGDASAGDYGGEMLSPAGGRQRADDGSGAAGGEDAAFDAAEAVGVGVDAGVDVGGPAFSG